MQQADYSTASCVVEAFLKQGEALGKAGRQEEGDHDGPEGDAVDAEGLERAFPHEPQQPLHAEERGDEGHDHPQEQEDDLAGCKQPGLKEEPDAFEEARPDHHGD